jgi:CubicO group peptidase (beta-lactamase class C family)
MRLLIPVPVLLLLVFFSCQQKAPAPGGQLEAKLDSVFRAVPDFSGVVLVAEKGRPVYYRAFGFRNFETREPLDTASVFELASVSKQFTAMTIMMLEEEGRLAYDDLIEKYIPGLPYPGVSIRHLLNHTSGLPDYQAVMDQYWDKTKVAGNGDNIEYLKQYRPAKHFEPGEQYEYSNTGYMLLASIAEKASGKDFITLCHERIFDPLAMSSTDVRTKEAKRALPRMAWGHIYVAEKQRYVHADSFPAFNYAIWLGNRKGPGRVSSTASDLLKWDQALYTEKLVKKETLRQAFSPATLKNGTPSAYGFGWMIARDSTAGAVVMHTGDNPGYKTKIVRYLDSNRTLILLCNNAHPGYGKIVNSIEAWIAGTTVDH